MELNEIIDLMWNLKLKGDSSLTYNNDKGLLDDKIEKIKRKYSEFNVIFKEKIDVDLLIKHKQGFYEKLCHTNKDNKEIVYIIYASNILSPLKYPAIAAVDENIISFIGGRNRDKVINLDGKEEGYRPVNMIENYLKQGGKKNEKKSI